MVIIFFRLIIIGDNEYMPHSLLLNIKIALILVVLISIIKYILAMVCKYK